MRDIAFYGYLFSGAAYLVLMLLLLTSWRGRLRGGLLVLATTATAAWSCLLAVQVHWTAFSTWIMWGLEVLHATVWVVFLMGLLTGVAAENPAYSKRLFRLRRWVWLLAAVAILIQMALAVSGSRGLTQWGTSAGAMAQLLFSVAALMLIEQLFRNTPPEDRWGIKYLCIGLGIIFVFDFFMFSDAVLFGQLDMDIWAARGYVDAMAVPLLAVSAARNPNWALSVFVSRRAVFHTTALFSAGVYMLLMALTGYYIKLYGGEWGTVLQVTFLFGAIAVLVALLFSGQLRSRFKVFLNKHFFSYQYDYRDEWLRLIGLLAGREHNLPLPERVILALGEVVDSVGGVLWRCMPSGVCRPVAQLNQPAPQPGEGEVDRTDPLVSLMSERRWVIDLAELEADPGKYDHAVAPTCVSVVNSPWLMVPLMRADDLYGFVVLAEPRATREINWENMDLLKTAGIQAASYLALEQTARDLADARQFEGFNRLSAFVIHDLKNLIAQLSLVARNAEKHKNNPEFIDDMLATIGNSVDKMNRLMRQLHSAELGGRSEDIDLAALLGSVVAAHSSRVPQPSLTPVATRPWVRADADRLSAVISHVVQNAQDATSADGKVTLGLRVTGDRAIVSVADTGTGMDQKFIEERLFRPFDSTKGLTGMGVGAYECREFVRALGGDVTVESEPGAGTRFNLSLPLIDAA